MQHEYAQFLLTGCGKEEKIVWVLGGKLCDKKTTIVNFFS